MRDSATTASSSGSEGGTYARVRRRSASPTPAAPPFAEPAAMRARRSVEPGATVDGTAEQCLVLAGGEVRAGAHLQRCIVDGNARFDLLSNSIVPTERS